MQNKDCLESEKKKKRPTKEIAKEIMQKRQIYKPKN
jgi:hypothetical protein